MKSSNLDNSTSDFHAVFTRVAIDCPEKMNIRKIQRNQYLARIKAFLSCVVLFHYVAVAQTVPRVSVFGKVLDDSTGQPLQFVNVFVANSSLGASTNEVGDFEIKNVPVGQQEIVASLLGYTTESRGMQVSEPSVKRLVFRLRQKLLMGPEMKIVAEYPKDWKKHFERFKEELLGYSRNAARCVISNPEVVDFNTDSDTHEIRAFASEPLIISNYALGYVIQYELRVFSMKGRSIRFAGRMHFVEIDTTDKREKELWYKNRRKAYLGSLEHFLSSVAKGDTKERGFRIYYRPRGFQSELRSPVEPNEIISETALTYERKLNFQGLVEVAYDKEVAEDGFEEFMQRQGFRNRSFNAQVSWIQLIDYFAHFNLNGRLYNPLALMTYGYWSFERVADMLPLDWEWKSAD